jgi:hypothetical protein
MTRKKLPIGIQTFAKIREADYYYVDKTPLALRLEEEGSHYFLSRPRRFGKSLFLDTLKELFEGNAALFKGLYAENHWNWAVKYPVIQISFAAGGGQSRQNLDARIHAILQTNQERLGVRCQFTGADGLAELIRRASEAYGQRTVVLIDEYDKPILDHLTHPDIAREMRDALREFYAIIKDADAHVKFVFLTGVTKFSRVSIFSGLNNLKDITLDPRYATICGYTNTDVDTVFAPELEGLDRERIRRWYNGYNWLGKPVYNPYDLLLLFDKRLFKGYWFETGTPTFLIDLFKQNRYFLPQLERAQAGEEILESFDVDLIKPVTLLFQAGYLTIERTEEYGEEIRYILRIPNQEVRKALGDHLVGHYTGLDRNSLYDGLYDTLTNGDLAGMVAAIQRLFAAIPWRNFTNNDLTESEGYYASVLYAFFASLNAEIIPEDISNQGQCDLTIKIGGYIYVMEIKRSTAAVKDTTTTATTTNVNKALSQITARGYSQKYRGLPAKGLYEVGLIFTSEARNLVRADWQEISAD